MSDLKGRFVPMDRERILLMMAEGVSTEDLNRLAGFFPHLLTEAVKELEGKVKYVQAETDKDKRAQSYIRGIRAHGKKAYANSYWSWLVSPTPIEPDRKAFGVGGMGAQAVRNRLIPIWEGK